MRYICCFIVFVLCVSTTTISAQSASIFDYLTQTEGTAIHLELDLTGLIHDKKKSTYYPATLTTATGQALAVDTRARGKYRRMNCEVPPLKLKFGKKGLRALGLDSSINEVKLVVPCFDSPESEQQLLREYAAYRIFEQLSPHAVKARLIQLTIRDRHVEKTQRPVWCMLTEHEEGLTARLNGSTVESYNLPLSDLNMEPTALNAVFQYMIGNTDWDLAAFRNIYLFREKSGNKIIPIPFDFDFSGLVSAGYSSPSSSTGLETVRDRLLMDNEMPRSAIRKAVQLVLSKKADILGICQHPAMSAETSAAMTDYLNTFFNTAETSRDLPVRLKNVR
jgi:hypothetical protein